MEMCYTIIPIDAQPLSEIEECEIIEGEEEYLEEYMEDGEQNSSTSYEEGSNATCTLYSKSNNSPRLEVAMETKSELRNLIGFQDLVRLIPLNTSFEEECEKYPSELYFLDT